MENLIRWISNDASILGQHVAMQVSLQKATQVSLQKKEKLNLPENGLYTNLCPK